jgi:hypothetical protein
MLQFPFFEAESHCDTNHEDGHQNHKSGIAENYNLLIHAD